jgi:hypothetical protein
VPVAVGVPRSEKRMVTWCSDSGERDQKSHIIVGDFRLVSGSRFCVWMKSPNFSGSRIPSFLKWLLKKIHRAVTCPSRLPLPSPRSIPYSPLVVTRIPPFSWRHPLLFFFGK